MESEFILPKGWKKPTAPISQAVKKGNMVFVSGQVSRNENLELVGKGDIKIQTRQALKNVRTCLEAAGAKMEDVVWVQVFLTDVANLEGYNEVYQEYFPKNFPARGTLIAKSLANKDYLIEIFTIAVSG